MAETVRVAARFRGPPNSGNGGYVSGLLAECFADEQGNNAASIEVTLRAPTPLDKDLRIERESADTLAMFDGDLLIAEAVRTTPPFEALDQVPIPPSFEAVASVADQSPAFIPNINPLIPTGTGFHPICVCCGADLDDTEGLKVFAAPLKSLSGPEDAAGHSNSYTGVAAAWQPQRHWANSDGRIPRELLWTALDCPGQFAYYADGIRTGMLGRMAGQILHEVQAEELIRVVGWRLNIERKKHFAGTALINQDGAICAWSRQTWIGRMDIPA